MSIVTVTESTLEAAGVSSELTVKPGATFVYNLEGEYTGLAYLERSIRFGNWETLASAEDAAISGARLNESTRDERYRFRLADTDGETPVTGEAVATLEEVIPGSENIINDGSENHYIWAAEVGSYLRMTKASGAKTVTVRLDATEVLPDSGEWRVRNAAAAGDVTLTPVEGVTLNAPADGTLVLEPGMTVRLKRVARNEFDVIGHTVAA